ncbi:MAG: Na+/H+ antiporter NhaA [Alphaproteobacteria bacterium]|nr:MAG: Na+/H+ antiporter NhaA [Alphaproteobacteria bacterium]
MPVLRLLRRFLALESAAGILVAAAAVLALAVENAPLAPFYEALLGTRAGVFLGGFSLTKPLLLWINDGLMAVFFFLVGLEIKREVLDGELAGPARAVLPAAAALGGMVLPVAIYLALAGPGTEAAAGWAIPAATDIAFALAVLGVLGRRVPLAAKVLLTAIAIIDDIGAILIIAVFYTEALAGDSLLLAGTAVAGLAILNRAGVQRLAPYIIVGVLLWVFVLRSGVHATLAGVLTAWAIPMGGREEESLLHRLEQDLHPWVAYAILPLFAFANAGVPLLGLGADALLNPVALGSALGLMIGKPAGVLAAGWLAVRLGIARLPEGVGWGGLVALGLLCGVGFTMSLFISSLAFADLASVNAARLGILVGSLGSAAIGLGVARAAFPRTGPAGT